MPRLFRALVPAFALVAVIAAPAGARTGDPLAVVASFNAALVDVMRQGKALGLKGRYAKLAPLVRQTHDMTEMTRLVVGPSWSTIAPPDRAVLVAAFTRHSVLAYATNFASFDGERFTLTPTPETRGGDVLVRGAIVGRDGSTALNYRMRNEADGWRIVDVYADGISQVAVQRSEFAATLKLGGAPALTAKLTALDDAKLK